MNQGKSPRVFISYCRTGDGPVWKSALVRALHVFEQHHLLDAWHDGKIRDGSLWNDDIKHAIKNAKVAVILLTREALESEYILETEFPLLRERRQQSKLTIFPVICEPCSWNDHAWLRATQIPNKSDPLSRLSRTAQDHVFRKLATDIAEELSRIAMAELPKPSHPPAPDHLYLTRLPLERGGRGEPEEMAGREQELALLDLAIAQADTAIVSLIAWGGVGKTMLVRHWLRRLQQGHWFGMRRVYAWSFYSQGTKEDRQVSEDAFFAHALAWFGVDSPPTLPPWDKGRLLADAIARENALLILDGIEPLQYPPGPMAGQLRVLGIQSMLKHLARKPNCTEHRGLCIVTSREPLDDLTDYHRSCEGGWGRVLRVNLGNLTDQAGALLLHRAGAKRAGVAEIRADDTELLAASHEVAGHALTLNLLGRFLYRAHDGDIRRRDLVKFEAADRAVQGGTTFKMLAAFENWFSAGGEFPARQLAVLRILGLFDRPADAGCIKALRKPPIIVGLTDPLFRRRVEHGGGRAIDEPLADQDWNVATSFLADVALVTLHADTENHSRLLDCHPLLREHFAEHLRSGQPTAWSEGHNRLFEHLSECTKPKPETMEDLVPLYAAVGHGCNAGRHEDALVEIYLRRVSRPEKWYSTATLGAWGADLACLASFFDPPWKELLRAVPLEFRGLVLNDAGYRLRVLGRLREAREPFLGAIQAANDMEDAMNGAQACQNLAELHRDLGEICEGVREAARGVDLADRSGSLFHRASTRSELAYLLHLAGRGKDALTIFREAEDIHRKSGPSVEFIGSLAGYQYMDFLLSRGNHIEVSARANATRVDATGKDYWILDRALNYLASGRALIAGGGDREYASAQLRCAINELRSAGQPTYLSSGLCARADLHLINENYVEARADLNEALELAKRIGARLHEADALIKSAYLDLMQDRRDEALASTKEARQLVDETDYHLRDEELEDLTRALGVI